MASLRKKGKVQGKSSPSVRSLAAALLCWARLLDLCHAGHAPAPKTILLWNSFYGRAALGAGVGDDEGGEAFARCPVRACVLTRNRSLWSAAAARAVDAVVVNADPRVFRLGDFPAPAHRRPAHRFVFLAVEPPTYCCASGRHAAAFNWTMTYRADSDVPFPYGSVVPRAAGPTESGWLRQPDPPLPPDEALGLPRWRRGRGHWRGPASAAWMVSRCESSSRREQYVRELARHMRVDVYGACGKPWPAHRLPEFHRLLATRYKFYLAFENSLCRDYATEKLFDILQLPLVPVVLGGANYSAIAPPHSYVDARDFASPRHLARYLHFLSRRRGEYAKYFWWKRHYRSRSNTADGLCRLCAMLHAHLPPKRYVDVERWWRGERANPQCSNSWMQRQLAAAAADTAPDDSSR